MGWLATLQSSKNSASEKDHHGVEPKAGHDHPPSHLHSNESFGPASATVRKLLFAATVPLLVITIVMLAVLWPRSSPNGSRLSSPGSLPPLLAATVTRVDLSDCTSAIDLDLGSDRCLEYTIRFTGGPSRGQTATYRQGLLGQVTPHAGDDIYVVKLATQNNTPTYGFYEFRRERPLGLLLFLFVVVAVLTGRRSGLKALVALALSMGLLIKFILPAIIAGRNPTLVALVGTSAVMFVALYLSHGFNVRTTSALLGTITSLAITAGIASVAVGAARFTGLGGEEAGYLGATADQIDLRGLLLAGIIVGALGVLDDVTVTQASAVWELHRANPEMGFSGRFQGAMRIGRDHIASVVNTLVLAYAGAALPLLLLFTNSGTQLGEILNGEPVATEVVRMLAGSIGLMAAVPITTALTSLVVGFDSPASATLGPARTTVGRPTRTRSTSKPKQDYVPPKAEREFHDARKPTGPNFFRPDTVSQIGSALANFPPILALPVR